MNEKRIICKVTIINIEGEVETFFDSQIGKDVEDIIENIYKDLYPGFLKAEEIEEMDNKTKKMILNQLMNQK